MGTLLYLDDIRQLMTIPFRMNGGKAYASRLPLEIRHKFSCQVTGSSRREQYTGSLLFRAEAKKTITGVPHNWKVLQTTSNWRNHSVATTWFGRLNWSAMTLRGPGCSVPLRSCHWITRMSGLSWQGCTKRMRSSLLAFDGYHYWSIVTHQPHSVASLSWSAYSASRTASISSRLMWRLFSFWNQVPEAIRSWWAPHPFGDTCVNKSISGGWDEWGNWFADAWCPATMLDLPWPVLWWVSRDFDRTNETKDSSDGAEEILWNQAWRISFPKDDMCPRGTCHSWAEGASRERKELVRSLNLWSEVWLERFLLPPSLRTCCVGISLDLIWFITIPRLLQMESGLSRLCFSWFMDEWEWANRPDIWGGESQGCASMIIPLWKFWWILGGQLKSQNRILWTGRKVPWQTK